MALEGEGGGEAVDVGEMVLSFEFGGEASLVEVGGDNRDWQLGNFVEHLARDARVLGAPHGIVKFPPIDDAHEEFCATVARLLQQCGDFCCAGAVFVDGHEGAAIEREAAHRSRSSRRDLRR